MEFEIGKEDSKKSVKQFLYNTLRLSHGQVTALKRQEQGILLNGERVFVTALLQEGDRLSLLLEDREEHKPLVPFACPLEILYEDETLLCVNKPPFMPTHPSLNHYDDTLANALAEYFRLEKQTLCFPGNQPSGSGHQRCYTGGQKPVCRFLAVQTGGRAADGQAVSGTSRRNLGAG